MGSRDIRCIALGQRREFTVKAWRLVIAIVTCGLAAGCATGGSATDPPTPSPVPVEEVSAQIQNPPRVRDSALGIDKLKHFLFAGYVESVGFAGMRALGAGRNASFAVAVGGVAVLSVAKEMRDRRTHGLFSFADLVWDALGAGAAYLILSRTPR